MATRAKQKKSPKNKSVKPKKTAKPKNGKQAQENGITRLTVKGYKSIVDECSIEIRPLTVLAGANSSGKSGIVQPFLMMKQTLEATYDPVPLLIVSKPPRLR